MATRSRQGSRNAVKCAASQTLDWGRTLTGLLCHSLIFVSTLLCWSQHCTCLPLLPSNPAFFHTDFHCTSIIAPHLLLPHQGLTSLQVKKKESLYRIFAIAALELWQKLWTGHTSQSRTFTIHKAPKQCLLRDILFPSTTSLVLSNLSFFKPPSSPFNSISLTTVKKHVSAYLQKSSSYELPGPLPPQPIPSLPRGRAFLLRTAHQQGSEFSRLPQVHPKEAQPHFSCVHWFHCFPPVAQLFGYKKTSDNSQGFFYIFHSTQFVWQFKPNLTLKAHWLHSFP